MNKILHFAPEQTKNLLQRINAAESTSIVGIPGSGITIFLRHLANETAEESIYIDVASLPSISTKQFFSGLYNSLGGAASPQTSTEILVSSVIEAVQKRFIKTNKVIIIIAGFDHLESEFSSPFFHYLQAIHAANPKKVVFIFGSCRKLDTILPTNLIDTNIRLFASTYYLKLYSKSDCQYLLSKYEAESQLDQSFLSKLIQQSGGHFQLLQILINSENKSNPIDDTYIQLVFKNILSHLTTPQKNAIKKLIGSGKYEMTEPFLTSVGIVQKRDGTYSLFSELFTEYIQKYHFVRLPIKERRLLTILKKNEGRVVAKNDIYDAVWRGEELGSEWALNALIYRLRRHPAFLSQSYSIESHKKIGYMLTRS